MSMRMPKAIVWSVLMPLVAGCATTGGHSQVEDTVYSTYRVVKNLDQNLGASVTKLNETAADLGARVDESERQVAKLQAMTDENRVKLDKIQGKLDKLIDALYRQLNLSTGSTSTTPSAAAPLPSDVALEAPTVAPAPTAPKAVEPLPSSPPAKTEREDAVAPTESAPAAPVATSNPVADYKRAQDSMTNGRFEEAVAGYKEFIQRYPDSESCNSAQYWIADCCAKLGRFEDAVTEFDKLRTNYPTSTYVPTALHNEAAAYLKLNQKAKAMELLKELVDNYPTSVAAERARAKLKELQSSN